MESKAKHTIDKQAAASVVKKVSARKKQKEENLQLFTFKQLYRLLNAEEKNTVQQLLALDPKDFDVHLPFIGLKEPPKDLVAIKGQYYTTQNNEKVYLDTTFLPPTAYDAYCAMSKTMEKDIGKPPLIKYGYRSPAYQAFTFLYWFVARNYNIQQALKIAALPAYSEHCDPDAQAVDLITNTGITYECEVGFDETEEYEWLSSNAEKYNFYLSYPKNNKLGIMFEPWHWRYSRNA